MVDMVPRHPNFLGICKNKCTRTKTAKGTESISYRQMVLKGTGVLINGHGLPVVVDPGRPRHERPHTSRVLRASLAEVGLALKRRFPLHGFNTGLSPGLEAL